MINFFKKNIFLVFLLFVVLVFFIKFLGGLLPIPADTIVGLYHPFRDVYAKNYPNGIPFKNFLITDPVRQTYPWKELVIKNFSNGNLPLWNPYEMAGKPLLGNFQSSPLYPLNIILFFNPFYLSWSLFIVIQLILSVIFTYFFLLNLKLKKNSSALGAIAFSFSGFVISWLEWGNVIHTALWLPLILLSIDRVFEFSKNFRDKRFICWSAIFIFSLTSSFLAGHLQIFFYVFLFSFAYLIYRFLQNKSRTVFSFAGFYFIFAVLIAIQLIPTLQFISLSARNIDQSFLSEGWFIPLKHLIQFIFPDFFGNPATLNYWGVWNYAEFIGYIGILPLVFAIYSIFFFKKSEKLFFLGAIITALIFSLQNPISEFPFKLGIPLISSSQPTRLIFIIVFSLSVLAAFGFDAFQKAKNISFKNLMPFIGMIIFFIAVWILNYSKINPFNISYENFLVVKRNLIFPTIILATGLTIIFSYKFVKGQLVKNLLLGLLLLLIAFDLLRVSDKFTPFSKKEYIYPTAKSIEFIKRDKEIFRVGSADSRIFPPNFLTHYRIQSIEGYDPLYLLSYAQLMAASERGVPDIDPPYGFNRIITPHNLDSKIIDLLNVKYVFSLSDIDSNKFEKVFEEGQTKIYKNKKYLPRVFFVSKTISSSNSQAQIKEMFAQDLAEVGIVGADFRTQQDFSIGKATVEKYEDNEIIVKTENIGDGFLIASDTYYPTWEVLIDGKKDKIYKTDYALRGVLIPSGKHRIIFKDKLFNL